MKTKNPQITQITQTVKAEGVSVETNQIDASQRSLRLRNLCNLRRNSFQEHQWTS